MKWRRLCAAYHEAGHVVLASDFGHEFTAVELLDGSDGIDGIVRPAREQVMCLPPEIADRAVVKLAGPLAEARASHRGIEATFRAGGRKDLDGALGLIKKLGRYELPLAHYLKRAQRLVRKRWPAITRVAEALLAHRCLDAAAVADLARRSE